MADLKKSEPQLFDDKFDFKAELLELQKQIEDRAKELDISKKIDD